MYKLWQELRIITFKREQGSGDYVVAMEKLNEIFKHYEIMLEQSTHPKAETMKTALETFKTGLQALNLSEKEYNKYQTDRTTNETLTKLFKLKKALCFQIIMFEEYLEHHEYDFRDYQKDNEPKTKSKTIILNKRNPFSDIQIKDNQYIYREGTETKTLAFKTDKTISKLETTNGDLLVIQPGFKVGKQALTGYKSGVDIQFDDTVTNKLIVEDDDTEYIYIT